MELDKGINDLFGLQKIINENPDKSIIVLDAGSKIVFINDIFIKTTGYSLAEIKGRSPLTIGLGDNSPEEFLELMDAMSKGSTYIGNFKNSKKNGEIYHTNTTAMPVSKNGAEISHYIFTSSIIENKKKDNPNT